MARIVRRMALAALLGVGLSLAPVATLAQGQESTLRKTALVLPGISLREGVTVDLALTIFTNDRYPCPGRSVLAVHGMLHAAAAWEPFTAALFDRLPLGERPCRVMALDLPGHGHSSLPAGALFGELTLDDYVSAVMGSLDRLHELGVYPETLAGHSLGGAILTLMQERLVSSATNLRTAHGVRDVFVLGGAILNPIEYAAWDSGAAFAGFFAYGVESAELGRYIAYPTAMWRNALFKNLATPPQFAVGTPSVEEIIARGYFGEEGSAIAVESRAMLESMVPRPAVDGLLFDSQSGTRLTMVVYEQDRLVTVSRSVQFYTHLTGDTALVRFLAVPGPNSVHDTHISAPAFLIDWLGAIVRVF